ncbi:MAG: sulfatase-like hydrolase/transferase [Acidobacteria bacterium]|nr:sulfatase-like hydrolase/transferase [Acidobacteriota bacterium]
MRAAGLLSLLASLAFTAACGGPGGTPGGSAPAAGPAPRHLLLVTIDTLRADRVGAYGYAPARTPHLDALAARGLVATRAYAAAPVTLPSHASLLTGRYPPAHGARHNGVAMGEGLPTLATVLKSAGFATGGFVSAFPLDRRFGLAAGFDVYGDRWARAADGRPADERAGQLTVDEALAWRRTTGDARMFLWVHLFEPHAPYGDVASGRPLGDRYDDEIAEADRQVGRLLEGLGAARAETLVVVTADHGEAFGEHGEIGHSLFVYDTTLRVPLIVQGPRARRGTVDDLVSLVDVAPTVLDWLGVAAPAMDGRVLAPDGAHQAPLPEGRVVYAETHAPFEDFGWSPLRAVRDGTTKYILAPTPELYDLAADAGETTNLAAARQADAARLKAAIARVAAARVPAAANALTPEARRRLQALGYLGGAGPAPGTPLADPKDRRALAARLAEVTSGELTGPRLEAALTAILADDPGNPQAALRLGYARANRGDCTGAMPYFRQAIAAAMPTADAHLGLAGCLSAAGRVPEALRVLDAAAVVEPGNPVVLANQGLLRSEGRTPGSAVPYLEQALARDPDLHQARFTLALVYARAGNRAAGLREATALLDRLPPGAPQRPEVARLVAALR